MQGKDWICRTLYVSFKTFLITLINSTGSIGFFNITVWNSIFCQSRALNKFLFITKRLFEHEISEIDTCHLRDPGLHDHWSIAHVRVFSQFLKHGNATFFGIIRSSRTRSGFSLRKSSSPSIPLLALMLE